MAARDKVFISYSHKDRKWLEEFLPHLKIFERETQMNVWADTQIRAGAKWRDDIQNALASAKVALMLVSANYLASDFIASQEIPPLLAAQANEGLTILWIAASASAYTVTPIREFQCANDPSKPLDMLPLARRNQKWSEIARKVYEAMNPAGATAAGSAEEVVDEEPEEGRIILLYKRHAEPDEALLNFLEAELKRRGYRTYVDRHLTGGMRWAKAISSHLEMAAAVIPLLSQASVKSEMLGFEVRIAYHTSRQKGLPRLLPVRVNFEDDLESPFDLLNPIQHFGWKSDVDNQRLVNQLVKVLNEPVAEPPKFIAQSGGGVRRDDPFYIERPSDRAFQGAIERRETVVLVKGARQMGKTSLLGRGLRYARAQGFRTSYVDFQRFSGTELASAEVFYQCLLESLAQGLEITLDVEAEWNPKKSPNQNLDKILRRNILRNIEGHIVWGMDEVDRLFHLPFASEFFALIRTWHNDRALSEISPWEKLTIAIVYATEAYTLITDLNQSPFNIGVPVELSDFTIDQVNSLNEKSGAPLPDWNAVSRFHDLLGGQPFLVRRGLAELAEQRQTLDSFMQTAASDDGPFGDHLRRLLMNLVRKPSMAGPVRSLLEGAKELTIDQLYSLRRAGIAVGASPQTARLRCRLYQTYLSQHLNAETQEIMAGAK